jgi:hypothetical protein
MWELREKERTDTRIVSEGSHLGERGVTLFDSCSVALRD